MSQQAQPGWYADPQGVVRWWDGQQWTDHVQQAEQVPDPSNGTVSVVQPVSGNVAAAGSGSRSGLMWFFALVAVAAVGVAVYFATKSDDKDPQAFTSAPVANEPSPPTDIPTMTPGEVVTAFFSSVYRSDCDTTVGLLSQRYLNESITEAADADVSLCDFLAAADQEEEDRYEPLVTIDSVDASDGQAIVTFEIEEYGSSEKVALVLEGGEWRLDRMLFLYDARLKSDLRALRMDIEYSLAENPSGDDLADVTPDFYVEEGFEWGIWSFDPASHVYCLFAFHPEASGYHSIDQDGLIYEDRSCGQE